jgi:hypothetical protein
VSGAALRLSELRIIELLEGLCDSMKGYEFIPAENSTVEARWARTSEMGANRNFDRSGPLFWLACLSAAGTP